MNSLKFVANTVIENLVKAARVNIITGEYHFIKEFEGEREGGCLDLSSMDEYPQKIVDNGWIYPDDELDYLSHMRLKYLREKLEENGGRVVHSFRRKIGETFSWITVEIIAPSTYSDKNPWVLYDWREADNDSRAMEDALCMLSVLFHKILKANLTLDTYEAIKVYSSEMMQSWGYSRKLSEWLRRFGETGKVYPDDVEGFYAHTDLRMLRDHFRKSREQIRYRYRRMSGDQFRWAEMILLPSVEYTDENQVVMLYVRDIHDSYTEELRYRRELEYFCNFDMMTGVKNRYYYDHYGDSCRKGNSAMPKAALFADINGLKHINDARGHVAGDQYIRQFAGILRHMFGEYVCCRISGDEFVVFFEEITQEELEQKYRLFRERLWQEEPPLAAVGYAYSENAERIDDLVTAAETEMYKDKALCHQKYPECMQRSELF